MTEALEPAGWTIYGTRCRCRCHRFPGIRHFMACCSSEKRDTLMTDPSIISQVRDEGYRAGYAQASMLAHDDAYIKGFDDATQQADGLAFTGLLCGITLAAFIWGLWAAVFPSSC